MYSSSTPSVYGSLVPNAWSSTLPPGGKLEPLPVIDGGISESLMPGRYPQVCAEESGGSLGEECVGLDLDAPGGIEQAGDHEHRRRGRVLAEELTVRASDRLPVGRIDEVDARADDVLGPAPSSRSASTMMSRQRFACSYGSSVSMPTGAVPAT